jgi:hypothetical protein
MLDFNGFSEDELKKKLKYYNGVFKNSLNSDELYVASISRQIINKKLKEIIKANCNVK